MIVYGTIYDTSNNQPLPGASVALTDNAGSQTGAGTIADAQGFFSVTSSTLDSGGRLLISAVSHKSVLADPSSILNTGSIGLDPDPQTLSPVTVTATAKKNYTPYLVGAGLLALFMVPEKKHRRVGKISDSTTNALLIGGGVIGGILLLKKILPSLNPFPTATNPVDVAATTASQAAALAAAKATGQTLSYPVDWYTGTANDIYKLGTASTVDMNTIVNDVVQVNNMLDLQQLLSAFGTKQSGGFMCANFNMYCQTYDLPSFLKAVLDPVHIDTINGYLSAQGIAYTF
jgi:hypothetical protein